MGCLQSRPSKASVSPEVDCARKPVENASIDLHRPSFVRNSMASIVSAMSFNFARFEPTTQLDLTDEQKAILKEHWTKTLLAQRPDFFHKVMLNSILQSPKMNEVIACQKYCVRDLSQWPKLDRMARGARDFLERQIIANDLDPDVLSEEARELGAVHSNYAQHGFKPAFLDIWQSNALKLAEKLNFDDDNEKQLFAEAWRLTIAYISEYMMYGYDSSMQRVRSAKKKTDNSLEKANNITNSQDDRNENSGEECPHNEKREEKA